MHSSSRSLLDQYNFYRELAKHTELQRRAEAHRSIKVAPLIRQWEAAGRPDEELLRKEGVPV